MDKQRDARSGSELDAHFRDQVCALRSSCENYDLGNRWEAMRIASAIVILCHDPQSSVRSRSKSLLGQMGLKNKLRFVSTARLDAHDWVPSLPLTFIANDEKLGKIFVPALTDSVDRPLPFSKWYDEDIFFIGSRNLSRKNLILTMRDHDGGAHIDERISNAEYKQLSLENDLRVKRKILSIDDTRTVIVDVGDGFPNDVNLDHYEPVPFAHFASMRQLGYELLRSVGTLL